LPSVQETIKFWVKFDGCPLQAKELLRQGQALCEIYGPGRNNTEVVLWTLEDAGHTWPGGNMKLPESKVGKTNRDINASELILEFFRKHSR
jgi:polyhydroxybutyrate depolymerase